MKILHLCLGNFYADNYSYQENMLTKYHVKMGHEVTMLASLVSFDADGEVCLLEPMDDYTSRDGFKVVRTDYQPFFKSFNKLFRRYVNTYALIEKEEPDIIFVHNCQFWDINKVVKYVKKHPGVKVFVDNHADYINSGSNWISFNVLHKMIWRHCAKSIEPYAEKFYGVTPLRCDFLRDVYHVSPKKIELLSLGVDNEKIHFDRKNEIRSAIREKYSIADDDFVLITGGKIDKRKNIHLLMEAIADMKKVKLIAFGPSNHEMKPIIDELSKSENVRYIKWVDADDVYDYFLASDLAVFPGTHSVLWEQAVGAGIPCVFKHWKGMDHVDVGGNCKFIYEENTETIRDTIAEIISNKELYLEMKAVAEDIGVKSFSYKEIAKRAIQVDANLSKADLSPVI